MATIPVVPSCLCCGEATRGGDFLPGHDAKYKAHLIREALAGGNPDAEAELERRGWTKFLDKRREVEARPKGEPRKPKAPDTNGNLHMLYVLRAGAKVLKATGQYRTGANHIRMTPDNVGDILELNHPDLLRDRITPSPEETQADYFGWNEDEDAAVHTFLLA